MNSKKSKIVWDKSLMLIYITFIVFYMHNGFNSFMPKYFGEIGITDSQNGIIYACAAALSSVCQPFFGSLTDRAKYKKTVISIIMFFAGIGYFLTGLTAKFVPVLIGFTLINTLTINVSAGMNAIVLEYTTKNNLGFFGNYGMVRMIGTVGYQLGALTIGIILSGNLRNLMFAMGAIIILAACLNYFMPKVEGHQHDEGESVSYFDLFKDKRVVMLFLMIFLVEITQQFNDSFLTKLQGNLGISNSATGIITVLSIALEIPACFFSNKIYPKLKIWWWLLIAFTVTAVRWIAYSFASTAIDFILIGLPGVTVMVCYELFPTIYLNEIVSDKLKASAQGALSIITFGFPKVIGALTGGFLSEAMGIQTVYRINGVFIFVLVALFIVPCKKMSKAKNT